MNRKDQEKLQVWQERLALAENAIAGERERMLRREQQYEGGHTIYAPDGTMTMKETLDLGLTIDERLADGYYYSKSIRLFKHLLAHPELLELPFEQEVDYD